METRVNIKVCEGCGCLWLRAHSHTGVYCAGCAHKLRDFASPQSRQRRGRPSKKASLNLWAVAEAAGGAL